MMDKISAKLSDHPNAVSDPNINPNSGAQDVNSGLDPNQSEASNNIKSGQGSHRKDTPDVRAGSVTSNDVTTPAQDPKVMSRS